MTRKEEVKSKVSIPMYFYNIIVPQLGSYYANYEVNFDVRPVACCPLHDEDTPSMRYYEETNTFYCFGCRRGGDIIALHRMFTERQTGTMPSLEESVNFLYDYFLRGNDAAQAVKTVHKLVHEEQKSSNVDLARYCKYSDVLEMQLAGDTSIPDSVKRIIWKAMDEADILVAKNELNAVNAMDYIKAVVRDNVT